MELEDLEAQVAQREQEQALREVLAPQAHLGCGSMQTTAAEAAAEQQPPLPLFLQWLVGLAGYLLAAQEAGHLLLSLAARTNKHLALEVTARTSQAGLVVVPVGE